MSLRGLRVVLVAKFNARWAGLGARARALEEHTWQQRLGELLTRVFR